MKVSEITDKEISDYIGLTYADLTVTEKAELNTLLGAAKAFISSYTGLTALDIDTHEDFVIVVYILVQDMYDNRTLYIEKSNLNKVVDTILSMHSINYI